MATVFIFHRDLRLEDNQSLEYALSLNLPILPVFIFTPEQVGKSAIVRSDKAIKCLQNSVYEVNEALNKHFKTNLCILEGDVITELNFRLNGLNSFKEMFI